MLARFKVYSSILLFLTFLLATSISVYSAETVSLTSSLDDRQSQLSINSSTVNGIELNVDVEAISLNPDVLWGGNYQQLDLPDGDKIFASKISETGQPELPVLTTMIAIPDMAGVTLTANYESYEIFDNVDVIPVQIPEPEGGYSQPEPFSMNMTTYDQDQFYPNIIAEAGAPAIMRDVRIVPVTVYPVHYNPVTRELKVYRNITVDISYEGEVVNPKTHRSNYISEAFLPIYKTYVANFDEYISTVTTAEVKRGGVLIITPHLGTLMWKDEMQAIADWKRQKGYDVHLATTYDVSETGRPTTTQLKTYIQNAYNYWDKPPEYVCLVGDEDISYGGYLMPDYGYSSYTSDHQYSCVDGTDWLPDVVVSRVAVDNINELNTWIAKTLIYEKDPLLADDPMFWRRAIMVAGGNQTVTCVWTVQWASERLTDAGFVQIDSVFERNHNDPPDYLITNPITAGVGFVNYRGWAGSSGWYDPSYNTSALSQCQNVNKPGVMTSIVCGTGNYGSGTDPCFGEVWIRLGTPAAPRGGPSFFGTTDGGTHTRWNNPISMGFYAAFLQNGINNFGAAAVAGKMRQYVCFPLAASSIQKYFHTYNMLGDPELEMRLTTPKSLNVVAPDTIELGVNNIEVIVTLSNEQPVENAYVTIIRGTGYSESHFAVTKTDANGYALLELPTDIVSELTLTVSGRDLHPHERTVYLVQSDETVSLNSFTIDDDMQGGSNGNNDGLISPTETFELSVELKNFGNVTTANNVIAQLVSLDEGIAVVHQDEVSYAPIAPGQVLTADESFNITVMPSVIDEAEALFMLNITSQSNPTGWSSLLNIPVANAGFMVSNVTVSGNGRLDPDEAAQVTIELTNMGFLDATDINGVLQTPDGYIHIDAATGDFGNISSGQTGQNTASPFNVTVDAGTFEGKNIPFKLYLTADNGAVYETSFNLTVGIITSSDPSGPDAYGYYMFDNTDVSYSEHPTYSWHEVYNQGGTNLYLSDDTNVLINLPFTFTYYGENYNRITVCDNGWISMDSTQWVGFRNWRMPDPSYARAMVAGFWDDLGPSGYNNVYKYYDSDNNRYIIEWYHVVPRDYTHHPQTFQIILYDPAYHQTITGDGIIEFFYNDIYNGDAGSGENYSSVGWENWDESDGFSISYANQYSPGCATLADNRVYRITTNNSRGGISGAVQVTGGTPENIRVATSTGQWKTASVDGLYFLKDIPPGTVDVTFSKTGWFPQTLNSVSITVNTYTSGQNGTLQQCPIPENLDASVGLGDHINLSWTEVTHSDVIGYDIYRSLWENGIYNKINTTPVAGSSYDDYSSVGNKIYYYYIVAVFDGADYEAVSLSSNIDFGCNEDPTGIAETTNLPGAFSLSQNYPNPFNAQTVINYALPVSGQVSLEIYNLLGQKITTLLDEYQQAGYKSIVWTGTNSNGNNVASGVYFYRLIANNQQITKRMLLLK